MHCHPTNVHLSIVVALAAAAAAAAPASAQAVTATATTASTLNLRAGAVVVGVPPGTNVSTGFALQAVARATAFSTLVVSSSPQRVGLTLTESANAYSDPRSGIIEPAAFGQHALGISLAASAPLRARLRVTCLLCPGDGFVSGSLTLGTTTVSAPANCTAATVEVPIALDPSGVTLTLVTQGGDFIGWPYFSPTTSQWDIEVLPDPNFPCAVSEYGNGCGGATLAATTSFASPGAHLLTLRDPGTVVIALLGFGTQRTAFALPPNCTILNNLALVLPAAVANGEATFTLVPPALPGLVFQIQGGVAPATGGLHLSNALEAVCP